MRRWLFLCFVLLVFPLFAQTSKKEAEAIRSLELRIGKLESDLTQQNVKVAQSLAELDRIKTASQEQWGRIETLEHQKGKSQESVERYFQDLQMQIRALEEQFRLYRVQMQRALAKVAPVLAAEAQALSNGLNAVEANQYAKAVTSFEQFLKQYSKSEFKDEALFWIAESRYQLKNFAQAIKDFQKFMEQFPKSEKVPQALLRQGIGFVELKMPEEAKVFLKKLTTTYPDTPEASQANVQLQTIEKEAAAVGQPSQGGAPSQGGTPSQEF